MSFSEVITMILTIPICIVAVAIILPIAYPELIGICAIIACTISLAYVVGFIIIWHFGIEDSWKHVLCNKCKTPIAISCTGYIHCVECNLGNEDFWYLKNPGGIV